MAKGMSEARIRLHFDVHEPIELVDLTLSFQAIAREYRSYLIERVRAGGGAVKDADVKLYVTSIKDNCILAELGSATAIMGHLFSTMDYAKIFVDFVNNISEAVTHFRTVANSGDAGTGKLQYTKRMANSIAAIVKLAAENKDGSLGLEVIDYRNGEEELVVTFKTSSDEAAEARRGALLTAQAYDRRGEVEHKDVLMYFHQANIEEPKAEGKTGFRGVIRSIGDTDLPIHFISDLDRDRINDLVKSPDLNPFKASYRVDVNVETDRNDKPKFYRVVALNEVIPDETG